MIARDVEELYRRHIRSLPRGKRLQLLARVARDLAEPQSPEPESGRSLRDLEGLGAEIWTGIDAQRYVDDLRREWDNRP